MASNIGLFPSDEALLNLVGLVLQTSARMGGSKIALIRLYEFP
jgi:hypothetical protein